MVDITAKLFWYRTKEWYEIMADKVNDIVYTDETKETVNVINLLLLGWILLGLIVYLLGNFVANYFKKQKNILSSRNSETADDVSKLTEHVPSESEVETEVENNVQELEKLQLKRQIPTCEGDDPEIVEWFNKLFLWIYNQRIVSPILDAWISALNARTRLSSTEHGILVDFNEVIHTSSAPKVTNAFQFQSSKNECPILTCDTEVEDVAFDIIVTQFKEKEKVSQHFTLVVKRLAGKAYIECMPEDVSFAAKYSEVPQVQLSVGFATSGNSAAQMIDSGDIQPLSDLVCEICHEAFASALINFRLACFPDCPRLSPKFYAGDEEITSTQVSDDKQLLVKIIKASNLGGSQGCLKPYCVVEMDEPPQRFETHCVEEKHNPFWDESYTFTVKDISAELLFEIYDKEKPSTENFLGLGIVSIEELLRNPSQRQMIPLQSRPLEDDDVTGTLTAEFLFLNQLTPVSEATHLSQVNARSDQLSETGKSVETNCRVTAGGTVITTTTIKRTNEDGDADLADTALKEIEKLSKPNSTSKSTLIIHSVQRVAQDKSGEWQEYREPNNHVSDSLEASPASQISKDSRTSYSESVPSSPTPDRTPNGRSRPTEKKSFMGTLRRKLSFHKARSKSVENRSEAPSTYSQASSRSASTDRVRHLSNQKSPFKERLLGQFLNVPGSTRSSISEASGVSGLSTRTYINENSTLVIETNENGIIKRYLIPNSLIHRSKWKKKGTKLHIYNDHVFIAKHLPGVTVCQVCQKSLTRRPGKQGYECRGCNLQCHKSCHVKVEEFCSNSSVNSMEVEYVHDPKTASPKSI
ncbi:C2 domain-containing protein 2 isoform X10 [Parasteatoda tepidariorum]|uniref:C2 domain-containing protein 2 isoform X10 n=1 Tax=Parasteatoda tepidariorum TaxID=114398 RepID=UPI001C71D7ED|nr:C2 domain-containing protein 2 isoform X7 [Parasteatoda tepidariorum]